MIYRYFFPKQGGGWIRRYWEVRSTLVKLEWTTPDTQPFPPLTLLDFRRQIDVADTMILPSDDGWRVSDDGVIGGYSSCTAALIQTNQCWKNHLRKQQKEATEDDDAPEDEKSSNKGGDNNETIQPLETPFLRWSGRLDTTIPLETQVQRSGFCALRGPPFEFDGANLRGMYNALEITCRASNPNQRQQRIFSFNMGVVSWTISGDTYQGQVVLEEQAPEHIKDDDSFQTFVLPFDKFLLTAGGRARASGRTLDDKIQIESLGWVLMDGVNGDFCFDLARIRAVNYSDETEMVHDPAVTAAMEAEESSNNNKRAKESF